VTVGEGAYQIESSVAGGTRVVLVASEPITQSSGDWVAVPKNTALVVSREKEGYIDIVRTPLHASGAHNRQEEVKMYGAQTLTPLTLVPLRCKRCNFFLIVCLLRTTTTPDVLIPLLISMRIVDECTFLVSTKWPILK